MPVRTDGPLLDSPDVNNGCDPGNEHDTRHGVAKVRKPGHGNDDDVTPRNFWGEIGEGVRWLWRHPMLRFPAFLVGGINFFSFGYQLILIVRAQELHANALGIGLLFAMGGVGGILGSLAASYLQRRFTFGTLMVLATWGWALTWIPYALAPNLATLFAAYIIGAPIVAIFLVVQSSYQLRLIPDELRGRVNSVFLLVTVGLEPLSITLTGVLLQAYGGVTTILIVFVPQVLLAALTTPNPHLRRSPSARPGGGASEAPGRWYF